MKIIKCEYCSKVKKTNGTSYINCCSIRQKITPTNWLNMPTDKAKNPTAIEENIPKDETKASKSLEVQELTETREDAKELPSPPILENDLDIEQEEEFTQDDYEYKCLNCGAYFDELNEGNCPNCDIDLTPYL